MANYIASGTLQILSGESAGSVEHGLGQAPDVVLAIPMLIDQATSSDLSFAVSADDTSVHVTLNTTAPSDMQFLWLAAVSGKIGKIIKSSNQESLAVNFGSASGSKWQTQEITVAAGATRLNVPVPSGIDSYKPLLVICDNPFVKVSLERGTDGSASVSVDNLDPDNDQVANLLFVEVHSVCR